MQKTLSIARAMCAVGFAVPAFAVNGIVTGDTYVSQANPGNNFGGLPSMLVGGGNTSLVQFTLGGLLPTRVTPSQVEKATLIVYVSKVWSAGTVDLLLAGSAWDEVSLTYNNLPALSMAGTAAATQSGQYLVFDVTAAVQGWVATPALNYGFALAEDAAVPGVSIQLDSKENTATGHTAILDVTVAVPAASPWTIGVPGPAGPAGPQGPPGPAGQAGLQGPAGPNVLDVGSPAAPSLNFTGNPNTGIYSASANTVNVATNGISRLAVRPDGDLDLTGNIRLSGTPILQAGSNSSLALGPGTLPVNTGLFNTALGLQAMASNMTGAQNTAVGVQALIGNFTGNSNTGIGVASLQRTASGTGNTAVGVGSLGFLNSGTSNLALGTNAGSGLTAGNNNVYVANPGAANESGVMRLGSAGAQTATFLAGVRGVAPSMSNAQPVVIDSNGQLGTVAAGVSGFQLVQTTFSSGAGGIATHVASCPGSTKVLGGGFSYPAAGMSMADQAAITMSQSYPVSTTQWSVEVSNMGTVTVLGTVWAVCATMQ